MSDSVVPTPSEKPKCKHGFDRWHDLGVTIGGGEFTVVDCPGPVIATAEKSPFAAIGESMRGIKHDFDSPRIHGRREGVSTEAQTPDLASAKTAAEYLAEYRSDPENEREFQAALKRDSAQATVPEGEAFFARRKCDPSPEIRERANELSRTLRLIKRLAIEHDTEIVLGHEYVDDLLLILDALKGEPK